MSASEIVGRMWRRFVGCRCAAMMKLIVSIAALMVLATAGVAHGQDGTLTVEVGKTECLGIKRAVDRHRVEVTPPGIARGRFDGSANRLCFDGEHRGTATATFTGTFRRIIVGSDLREDPRPFKDTVDVRVVPPAANVTKTPRRINVRLGSPHRVQLRVYLTSAFASSRDENEKWRSLGVTVENPDVVKVDTLSDRGRMYLQFTALRRGQSEVRLTGERRLRRDWQEVVRVLNVRVP